MAKRQTSLQKTENGIAELLEIPLGGYKQMVLIRGENRFNPILLFLHGGPGTSNIGIETDDQKDLEKNFVVVNWDQLGSGLSYQKKITKSAVTLDNMLQYTSELVEYLLGRFVKTKLYLVGHSWGSLLGLRFVEKHPEYIEKYVSISQYIGGGYTEETAYNYCVKKAQDTSNRKALKQLEKIGKPPYENWMKGLQIRNKWSITFGAYRKDSTPFEIYKRYMRNVKEYKFLDIFRYMKGISFSLKCLWPEAMEMDLYSHCKDIKVPLYFLLGKHDYTAPFFIAEEFIGKLNAESKEIIWFENSAHICFIEEKEKFLQVMNVLCRIQSVEV